MDVIQYPLNSASAPRHEGLKESIASFCAKIQCINRNAVLKLNAWQESKYSMPTYLALVASVAIYDIFLTIRYAPCLQHTEENPIARWIMQLDSLERGMLPDITLFLAMKSVGTLIVLTVIYCLLRWRTKGAHCIASGVSSFQLFLAYYLTFFTPS